MACCVQHRHMTGRGGRGREQRGSRATAEFGLSLEGCTSAGDDWVTHTQTLHLVSVSHSGRVCMGGYVWSVFLQNKTLSMEEVIIWFLHCLVFFHF